MEPAPRVNRYPSRYSIGSAASENSTETDSHLTPPRMVPNRRAAETCRHATQVPATPRTVSSADVDTPRLGIILRGSSQSLWHNWTARRLPKPKVTGSNPVGDVSFSAFFPGIRRFLPKPPRSLSVLMSSKCPQIVRISVGRMTDENGMGGGGDGESQEAWAVLLSAVAMGSETVHQATSS